MKRFTYKKLREWELHHGESFLDYFGDETLPDIEKLVVYLEGKYPHVDWREDLEWGIMGLSGPAEDAGLNDYDADSYVVERAFICVLTDEESFRLRKKVKEYDR